MTAVKYEAIVFKPFKGEVLMGQVKNVAQQGVFCQCGPMQVFIFIHQLLTHIYIYTQTHNAHIYVCVSVYCFFSCYSCQRCGEEVPMWPHAGVHIPTHTLSHTHLGICISFLFDIIIQNMAQHGVFCQCGRKQVYMYKDTQTHVHMYACIYIIILVFIMIDNVSH